MPSRFMQNNYSQIDSLMSECGEQVPDLIGQIRPARKTNASLMLPIGYSTKQVVGDELSAQWQE